MRNRTAYQREYMRAWRARKKREFLADKVCARCGSDKDLQVDHIVPRCGGPSSPVWLWPAERRDAEMLLCQMLCEPCHIKKTIADMPITHGFTPYTHGTESMYRNRKCKCAPCRAKMAQINRRHRQKASA